MKAIGVIPARYASTRFPAKVLANLAGKPVIAHVWEKAKSCQKLDEVLVACDHDSVFKAVKAFGANAVMTKPEHPSGSDRIAEAISTKPEYDIIINIQGDEPFIDPKVIDSLVDLMKKDSGLGVATAVKEIVTEGDLNNPNVVKCVIDESGCALYFSRSPIPYNRNVQPPKGMKRYKHIGIYAYRRDVLNKFTTWSKTCLESIEQLEQLRFLEKGHKIKTIVTDYESVAIDVPEDLEKAHEWLERLS